MRAYYRQVGETERNLTAEQRRPSAVTWLEEQSPGPSRAFLVFVTTAHRQATPEDGAQRSHHQHDVQAESPENPRERPIG